MKEEYKMSTKMNLLSFATLASVLGAVVCALAAVMIGSMTAVSSVLLVATVGFAMVALQMYGLAAESKGADEKHIKSQTLPALLFVIGAGLVLIVAIAL